MNSEKVQQIINKTIENFHNKIGGRAARKQYAPAKHQIETLTELGLIDLMPKGFGHGDAKVVIEAAQEADSAIMNAYGEGEEIPASALNQAINEEAEEEIETSFGSEYEIEIYNADNEDMVIITSGLYEANVSGDNRDKIGFYLRDGRSNSVWVEPSDVGRAVEIINTLGFGTDEDA